MKVIKRVAKADIYENGVYTPDSTKKSGYKFTRKSPSPDGDRVLVKKGQEYYSWGIWGETKLRISLTPPTKADLTSSTFKKAMCKIQDILNNTSQNDAVRASKAITGTLDMLLGEYTLKLENMPEQLKNNKAGSLLKQRIQLMENIKNQLSDAQSGRIGLSQIKFNVI